MKDVFSGGCALTSVLVCCLAGTLHAQVAVTTYHNDLARTGQFTQETILSPANVNSTSFGKLFTTPVDGYVYAQPLYLPGVGIAGGTHNVLYVATEHDSVYAIDADSGAVYRQVNLIPAGERTVVIADFGGCNDILPEVGITSTPVIDTNTGTLYVVAKSIAGGAAAQYLHAVDVTTLQEKFGGPVLIQASVPGKAADGNGTMVSFAPFLGNQRAALLLQNGHVIIGWGSHCDIKPWHGWVMSYSASTLTQEAVFNTSPNGSDGGVWMGGGGLAADSSGNLYFATGNGSWNGTTDFGDSILKLGPPAGGSFPMLDYFTPYNQGALDSKDTDVGSGAVVLLPTLPSGQQLLAHQGKQGTIYLLDRSKLGGYCIQANPPCSGGDPQIVQEIPGASPGIWGSPAYWNGNLYWAGANDTIHAYSLNASGNGLLSKSPTSKSAQIFPFAAPIPTISANGNSNGILWALDGSNENSACIGGQNCLGLYAFDATNLSHVLYQSGQAANNRDSPGSAVKFTPPIIVNGKVYIGAQGSVSAYGLLGPPLPPAATPSFSPTPGSFPAAQSVMLTDNTPNAVIHYTTNGTTPTASSPVYSSALPVASTTTIRALAVAPGYANSPVAVGTYTIAGQPGTALSVSIAPVANVVAAGLDGSPPPGGGLDGYGYAYSATLLGASVNWAGTVFSLGAGATAAAVSSQSIPLPAANAATLSLLGTAVAGSKAAQNFIVNYTDGSSATFTQSLSDWASPQNFAGETKVLPMAYRLKPSGATDNRPFYLYGYSFALDSTKTLKSLTLPNNRGVVILAVDVSLTGAPPPPPPPPPPPAAAPSFSPTPGSFPAAQSVMLTDNTPNAVIHYTTNGSTPTASSPVYSSALQIASTTTLQALAVAPGYANSTVSIATYTITSPLGTPISVPLASVANVVAAGIDGSPPPGGGLDAYGYAYSGNQLGASVSWAGANFTLGAPATPDAVSGLAIPLPAASASTLSLLGTAVGGSKTAQNFIVNYTDGSSATFTQSLSDWASPQNYAGESTALLMTYRLKPSGVTDNRPFRLYGYSFLLNNTKTLKSITLPTNRGVVILAIDLVP